MLPIHYRKKKNKSKEMDNEISNSTAPCNKLFNSDVASNTDIILHSCSPPITPENDSLPPHTSSLRHKYSKEDTSTSFLFTDEYGFITDKSTASSNFYSGIKMQWFLLIDKYGFNIKKFRKAIKDNHLLEKGIPLSLKNKIWSDLLEKDHIKANNETYPDNLDIKNTKNNLSNKTHHQQSKTHLLATNKPNANLNYETLKEMSCKYEYQIHVDIQRTFRHHILFFNKYSKGQSELFNLLVAIANSNNEIGYCQGMSDICAVLLMYFNEEDAFQVYNLFIEKNNLGNLFDKNLSKLPEIIDKQNRIFSNKIPKIQAHFRAEQVDFSIYSMGWYLTLFSRFNIRLVLRIWDFLFFYGFNILMYFAAAILKYYEKDILESRGENLIIFLSKINDMKIDEDIIVSMVDKLISKDKLRCV